MDSVKGFAQEAGKEPLLVRYCLIQKHDKGSAAATVPVKRLSRWSQQGHS